MAAGRKLYLSTAVVAGSIVTPGGAVWNTTPGVGGGIVGGDPGDKYVMDRSAKFDPAGFDFGESGPMRPRAAVASLTAAGGGAAGGALAVGTYRVAFAWVDDTGLESPESPWSGTITVAAGNIPQCTLPAAPHPHIVGARLYLTNTSGTHGTFTRYSTSDITVSLSTTTVVTLPAAHPGTGIAPENGALRLTHSAARYWPTGLCVCRGDIMDARTGSTGLVYAADAQADTALTRFDSQNSAGATDNIYGLHFGVVGTRGGLRLVRSAALASPFVVGTRPTVEAAGGGAWRMTSQVLAVPAGDFLLLDARITDYSDQPMSKRVAQAGAPAVGVAPTLAALTGGAAGTGTLSWDGSTMTYRVAYAFVNAALQESARSPWSALIGPGTSGNIPMVTIPSPPAGTAWIHVFVQPGYMRASDSCTRYLSFLPATPGQTYTTPLNKTLSWPVGTATRSTGLSLSVWTGGEVAQYERTWFQRGGTVGTVGNFAASAKMLDRLNVFTDCVDAPISWPSVSAITAGNKEVVGTVFDTQFSPQFTNPSGLVFGTDTDPVWVGNLFPSWTAGATFAAGSRAMVRASRGNGGEWPGDMKKFLVFVDGSNDFGGDRDVGSPSRATANWHGWVFSPSSLAQAFDDNEWVSYATNGTGDLVGTLSTAPSGPTAWSIRWNVVHPDMGDQRRRSGDFQQNGADTATQRIGLYWEHNTGFIVGGSNGEKQLFHINETTAFPGVVKSYKHNLPWSANGVALGRHVYDFHGSGYRTDGPILYADWNASHGLDYSANVDAVATTANGVRGYGIRDGGFRDGAGAVFTPDNRGGAGPLIGDPLFRAKYRSPLTYSWAERGFALGAVRPSGAVVSNGTAENRGAMPEDMEDWCQWAIAHWHDHRIGTAYVQADGSSVLNVLEGIRGYTRWGVAPTAASYNPALNNGETPGAVAWVSTSTGGYGRRRRRRRALNG